MKRLYLDVCIYCRSFDHQNAIRVRLETEAFYLIMRHVEQGKYQLIVSPVHVAEINAIPALQKRLEIQTLLKPYDTPANYDSTKIYQRIQELSSLKLGIADASHVAFAEQLAEVFLTCDDKLLKKCKRASLTIPAMNPLEFLVSEGLQ